MIWSKLGLPCLAATTKCSICSLVDYLHLAIARYSLREERESTMDFRLRTFLWQFWLSFCGTLTLIYRLAQANCIAYYFGPSRLQQKVPFILLS